MSYLESLFDKESLRIVYNSKKKGGAMMEKKTYKKPFAEKIEFDYRDQVVVASNTSSCKFVWLNEGKYSCSGGTPEKYYFTNG